MTDWKPGDRVKYDDHGTVFTAVLDYHGDARMWIGHIDGIAQRGEHCKELQVGDRVTLIEGHSTKISDGDRAELNHREDCTGPEPTPATDPIGTVRVHPNDDPEDPNARRVIHGESRSRHAWVHLNEPFTLTHEQVTDWPRQSLMDVARVLGHEDYYEHLREVTDEAISAYLAQQERERDRWKQCADSADNLVRAIGRAMGVQPDTDLVIAARKLQDRAERLERERDEARKDSREQAELVAEWAARAEKAEAKVAHYESLFFTPDEMAVKVEELQDQVSRMAVDWMTVGSQASANYDRAIRAEKRASAWWEAAKQFSRGMNHWVETFRSIDQENLSLKHALKREEREHRYTIEDLEDAKESQIELDELKSALRTLAGK